MKGVLTMRLVELDAVHVREGVAHVHISYALSTTAVTFAVSMNIFGHWFQAAGVSNGFKTIRRKRNSFEVVLPQIHFIYLFICLHYSFLILFL